TETSRTAEARCALRCSTRTKAMINSSRDDQPGPVFGSLKTDPLARTPSLPPLQGRAGGGGAFTRSPTDETVSRFPGPPHSRSPHKPPSLAGGGAGGGSRWAPTGTTGSERIARGPERKRPA